MCARLCYIRILLFVFLFNPELPLSAQIDTIPKTVADTTQQAGYSCCALSPSIDSAWMEKKLQPGLTKSFRYFNSDLNHYTLSDTIRRKRAWLIGGANVLGYGGAMIGLYNAWYKDYPQTRFHFFNDIPEWLQVDKAGHFYSAYVESRGSMELWRWAGVSRKSRIWLGGMSGMVYQTVIETLDGFSAGWGWSWGDFGANVLGSATLISQELAWNDQRIKIKFSFHSKKYRDPQLQARSTDLYGKTESQRFIKDYNGQTYWASVNIRSFFPASKWPQWLSLSVGYGAEGMFGARDNIARDANGNITFSRTDVPRYRQWFFAPDIDLSKIKTKSKLVNTLFTFLNAFKFPAPALVFSKYGVRGFAFYF